MTEKREDEAKENGSRDRPRALSAVTRVRKAREQFEELTGYSPESVSALSPSEDGWEIQVEVLELSRIPDTMSLLASYRVTLDDNGDVITYERGRRYTRGQGDRS